MEKCKFKVGDKVIISNPDMEYETKSGITRFKKRSVATVVKIFGGSIGVKTDDWAGEPWWYDPEELSCFLTSKEKIAVITERYGYDAQSRQCIEEMAELTQAINKFWRKQLKCGETQLENAGFGNEEYNNLVEELADVSIMLEQMIYFMDCENRVCETMNEKLDRQMKRIEEKRNANSVTK